MVGAVVVAGRDVVGEGFHARYGEAHAEVNALAQAGDRARGATLYVTLEPCAHFGKTPPCTDAVIASGVTRVVIAVRDPSEIARGGVERLRAAGIAVDVGFAREKALELNAQFFNAHGSERPWVTLKLAVSSEGAIADPTGTHRWITGPESRAEVHRLRANADAVAVGIGTVLADDPSLTVRDAPAPRVPPSRIVFDTQLRIPLHSVLVKTARHTRTLLVAGPGAWRATPRPDLAAAGVDIMLPISLSGALTSLRARGIRSLFVESGPRLAGSFLREGLVDRLVIFRSSLVLGRDAPRAFAHAPLGFEASLAQCRVVEQRRFGDDLMTTYALRDIPCSPD
jgi:diaminohydroxyphosphoribosylaminopyrimidine deaminase/5-amino-6-(5-phosphoribosylamino)uracil reductase